MKTIIIIFKRSFMKKNQNSFLKVAVYLAVIVISIMSCQKESQNAPAMEELATTQNNSKEQGHLFQTKRFSSDVVTSWLNIQLDMLRVPLAPGTGSQAADRAMAYCGIAAYEAVVPGMPAYQSLFGQLTNFPEMPATEPGKAYHWAASANAALAEMNRKLFPNTSATNKTNIDNLENTLKAAFANETDVATLVRSVIFGKEVATRVFAWATTDGFANVNPPYVPPPGEGFWQSTPPNFPAPVNPYLSQRRFMVAGVSSGTSLEPPPAYSTNPASPFFLMVKDVYDKKENRTPEQEAMAIYHRDAPGYPGGGQFVAILSQVIDKANVMLDIAALAYAKTGIAMFDVTTILFTHKYSFNLVRPITYIRNVMGHSNWLALFNTPPHPEFPAGHAVTGANVATILTDVFGENFQFENHSYDYLNLPPRHYNSFSEMAQEMADSRVYAGIHYQATCDKSLVQGKKVAANVLNTVKFLKD